MTRTLITTALTVAVVAISAQGAQGAMSNPKLDQEMDHGAAPALEASSGYGTGSTAPAEPSEPPAGAEDQGISTSPGSGSGATDPAAGESPVTPEAPVATQAEESDKSVDVDACADHADQIDQVRAHARAMFLIAEAFGGWDTALGSSMNLEAHELDSLAQQLEGHAEKDGCYGEVAE